MNSGKKKKNKENRVERERGLSALRDYRAIHDITSK